MAYGVSLSIWLLNLLIVLWSQYFRHECPNCAFDRWYNSYTSGQRFWISSRIRLRFEMTQTHLVFMWYIALNLMAVSWPRLLFPTGVREETSLTWFSLRHVGWLLSRLIEFGPTRPRVVVSVVQVSGQSYWVQTSLSTVGEADCLVMPAAHIPTITCLMRRCSSGSFNNWSVACEHWIIYRQYQSCCLL